MENKDVPTTKKMEMWPPFYSHDVNPTLLGERRGTPSIISRFGVGDVCCVYHGRLHEQLYLC